MLKIRLQGTVRDIRWFKRLLEKHPEIRGDPGVRDIFKQGNEPIFSLLCRD